MKINGRCFSQFKERAARSNYCTTSVSFAECTKLADPELKVPTTVKL